MALKRLQKEYADLMKSMSTMSTIRDLVADDNNFLHWEALLVPSEAPYNKGAFKISLDFPSEYPFKPPKVIFKTHIYHPNVDENGAICLDIVKGECWKPATKVENVLQALIALVMEPNPSDPLVTEIAELYLSDRKAFNKKVEDHCKKFAEKRPKK